MDWLVWMVTPTVAVWAFLHVPDAIAVVRRAHRRLRPPPPVTCAPPIERIAADLRRLHARLRALRDDPHVPHRAARLRATELALGERLGDACRALGLGHLAPLALGGEAGRDQVLLALTAAGLAVSDL